MRILKDLISQEYSKNKIKTQEKLKFLVVTVRWLKKKSQKSELSRQISEELAMLIMKLMHVGYYKLAQSCHLPLNQLHHEISSKKAKLDLLFLSVQLNCDFRVSSWNSGGKLQPLKIISIWNFQI